jgi:hypothetical protein
VGTEAVIVCTAELVDVAAAGMVSDRLIGTEVALAHAVKIMQASIVQD